MIKPMAAFVLLVAVPSAGNAQGFADLADVDAAAFRVAGPGAQPADRRLRLVPCKAPLSAGWHAGRRDTVLVQCPDPGGWRLFVPVINAPSASAPETPAVLRGEAVTVAVSGEGFTVSQPGEALEGGAVGAWIRVRLANGGGAQSLRGRVVRPGLVSIAAD